MGKLIGNSTVIEHKGIAKLKTFCANNIPFLVCRDETITDVGIDGEIEISFKNQDGKREASGERIKFQLKSTESDNSYIQQESETEFQFYANQADVEYWTKHKQDVLLIIYDVRNDKLYGKRISKNDLNSQKQKQVKLPVYFNKSECLLESNNFDFHKKFSTSIKERLNFDLHEPAITNLLRFKKFPKVLYSYETSFTKKDEVYKKVGNDVKLPEFIIYNKQLFTFVEPKNQITIFKTDVINIGTEKIIHFSGVTYDKDNRNHFVELIRIYFKNYLGSKGIFFNRDYRRFYFAIKKGEGVRSILAKTRKREKLSAKEVVRYYDYVKYKFFRHLAFEIEFIHASSMYLTITPTYLITEDGKIPVDGKIASKFIIPQKSREYNPAVANQVHSIFSFLANSDHSGIDITNSDNLEIQLSSFVPQKLPFSISTDDKGFTKYLKAQRMKIIQSSVQPLFNE